MIKSLFIKNYALIDELHVEFDNGLVIVTGETGAGKSIIVDALGLIIGARASADVVRAGAEKAIVEGIFHVAENKKLKALLSENDVECGDALIARREVASRGQSRCFVNDSPVTNNLLKSIGELLVDLHGQHEHQSLLRVDTHIGMLDDFGGLDGMVGEYQEAFRILQERQRHLDELIRQKSQLQEKREIRTFHIKEIDGVSPETGEEDRLSKELTVLENAEKLFSASSQLYEKLYEGDLSVHDQLVLARNQLQDLATIDTQFDDAAKEGSSALAIIGELAKFVQRYNSRIEFNPERLEELRSRLGQLAMLKKKFGGSIESVLAYRETIGQEASLAENFDEVIAALKNEAAECLHRCKTLAKRISAKRTDTARKIDKAIMAELAKLGIKNGRFRTAINQKRAANGSSIAIRLDHEDLCLNTRGMDEVEFFISTNLGEDDKPLAKVASGGEVSRIMLALKTILAKSDRLPVLIFDEIDVGVSGRIAQTVGRSLKSLSSFHQVIAITHLPQIAGLANSHFAVVKHESNGHTATSMQKLTVEERIREVARLMSGEEVTRAGLAGAKELMGLT